MAVLSSGNASIKSSHWYTATGEPAHVMPKADGNGERPTTLRDAKKLRLLPSVTNILHVIEKPALNEWKYEQIIKACLASGMGEKEDLDYYMRRIQDAAFQQVEDAADLGSQIHKAIEQVFKGEESAPEMEEYIAPAVTYLRKSGLEITANEQRIVSVAEGYAGTTDMLGSRKVPSSGGVQRGIVDLKSKKTKPGKKVEAYDEHRMQLAAYAAAVYGPTSLPLMFGQNLFISTTEPGRVELIEHTGEQLAEAYNAFVSLCAVWRFIKKYDPRQGVVEFPKEAAVDCDTCRHAGAAITDEPCKTCISYKHWQKKEAANG